MGFPFLQLIVSASMGPIDPCETLVHKNFRLKLGFHEVLA